MLLTRSVARNENLVLFSAPEASVWVENAPRDYLATIIYGWFSPKHCVTQLIFRCFVTQAVVMTVMLYDILLTLDDEVGVFAFVVAGYGSTQLFPPCSESIYLEVCQNASEYL